MSSDLQVHLRTEVPDHIDPDHVAHWGFYHMASTVSTLFHVSIECSGVITLLLSFVLTAVIIRRILVHHLGAGYPASLLTALTVILMMVQAIWLPLFDAEIYRGRWGPSVWHNPTIIASKPLALCIFHLFPIAICGRGARRVMLHCLGLSVVLLACTHIKPSFALVFIPVAGLHVLMFHARRPGVYIAAAVVVAPTVALMLWQYSQSFAASATSGIGVELFRVWGHHADFVPLAILQAIAMPLLVLVVMPRSVWRDRHLVFAWMYLVVATGVGVLLYETGPRETHGNFLWSYVLALHLIFIYSVAVFLRGTKRWGEMDRRERRGASLVIGALGLHFLSGVYHLAEYMITGSY